MRAFPLAIASALLVAAPALAQSYVATATSAPYAALTSPTVPQLDGGVDNGFAHIPIGFGFTFYGNAYTTLTVTTDGMVYLEPNPGTAAYPSNMPLPSPAAPNAVLAPFWDNLKGSNPFSRLGYQLTQTANGKVLTVEWRDWNHWSSSATYDLDFQLRLHESGIVEFHYGAFSGAGTALSASVGIEDPTGGAAVSPLGCSPNCAASSISANTLITFGPGPNTVDLIAGRLAIDQITEANGILSIDTRFTLQNFGTQHETIEYALYLSSDTVIDAGDVPLAPATQGPLAVNALAHLTHAATSTVPKPSSGSWYLLAQLDPSDAIIETSEGNNQAASSPLVSGLDLWAQAITANVAASGPGEPIVNTLEFANLGLTSAGAVQWRVLLSADTTVDAQDFVVTSGTTSLGGGQGVVEQVSYVLPANVPSGSYYFALQLDPANLLAEVAESNNVVFSTGQFTSTQADLIVARPRLFAGTPPHAATDTVYLGEPFRMELDIVNVGGASAKNFSVLAYLSENDLLNVISDPEAGELNQVTLAPGASATIVLNGTVPSTSVQGVPLLPGPYFLFGSAISHGNFVEMTPSNNFARLGPIKVSHPGPDLIAASVIGPSEAAADEVIPVSRLLKNVGNRDATAAKYRFVLSRNELVTEQDPVLPIVPATGAEASEGQVVLAAGQSDLRTEWVRLPAGLVPSSYRIGVLIDPRDGTTHGAVAEIDELNNGLAGSTLTVVEPRFAFAALEPADAVVGVPYHFGFAARGAVGQVTFTAVDPAELPEGLSLQTGGTLSGTAVQPGVFPFTLRAVDAAGQTAVARFVFRAVPASGVVTVTSSSLPAPAQGTTYLTWLTAQGGKAPYRWRLHAGELPPGIVLEESGRLGGVTTAEAGTSFEFTAQVVDAVGNADLRRYALTVIAPGALYIQAAAFADAQVGTEFAADLIARFAGTEKPEAPVWELVSGALPPGVALTPQGDVAILRGAPTRSGVFAFTVQVTDAKGRLDTAQVVLTVAPSVLRIVSTVPGVVLPGSEVSGTFAFEGGGAGRFQVISGALPQGVTVAEDGTVSGRIADDALFRTWTFTVRGVSESGQEGLLPASIEVAHALPQPASGCGCAASSPSELLAIFGALAWLAGWAGRNRRRTH